MRTLVTENMACALRLGRSWPKSLRSVCIAPRRAYSNGGDVIPLTFSSPTEAFYNNVSVKQVDVFATSGAFGILPNHVPSIAVLMPGQLTVHEQDKTSKYFVSSGTVTINADSSVQILAEEAVPMERLDLQAARQGLEKCQQKLSSASTDVARAEANVGIELYNAMIKALEG